MRAQVALHELEIGPADGAGSDAQEQLAGSRGRVGHLAEAKGLAALEWPGSLQDERAHHAILTGR
jgi:hypothetical protein